MTLRRNVPTVREFARSVQDSCGREGALPVAPVDGIDGSVKPGERFAFRRIFEQITLTALLGNKFAEPDHRGSINHPWHKKGVEQLTDRGDRLAIMGRRQGQLNAGRLCGVVLATKTKPNLFCAMMMASHPGEGSGHVMDGFGVDEWLVIRRR